MNRVGWEPIWSSGHSGGRYGSFAPPNDTVVAWADSLPARAHIFDLGCGVGRHVIYLGERGFPMAGIDVAPSGIERANAACAERGITFDGKVGDMSLLPWPDATFDGALSTSAVHHALRANIQRSINEIWRILKPGGSFLVDFPSTDRADFATLRAEVAAGNIHEVEPNTFVDERPDSDDPDGFLPHHYSDEPDVHDLLSRFMIERLAIDPGEGGRGKWVAWARKV